MNRLLRPVALAALSLASSLPIAAQSEPAPLPVTPVPAGTPPVNVSVQPQTAQPAAVRPAPAVDESKTRLEKLEAELAKAKADLAKAQSDLKTAKTGAAAGSGKLRADLEKAAGERNSLAAQVATLSAEKQRAESALDQARVDLASVRARLEVYEKSLREGAAPGTEDLRAALREAQGRVDMTVRAFAIIEQENNRIRAQLGSSNPQTFQADLASAEAGLVAAQRELAAEKIRSANLARELAKARPDMPLVIEEPPTLPAPVAPTPPADEPAAEVTIHTVVEGETLSGIAKQHYGSASRWTDIYGANRDVMRTENHLVPGMKLRIP